MTIETFYIFLLLGLRSFGGPVAHIGYFHKEFVDKRRWLTEKEFADTTAMCQFLPGPASSQVGFSIGYKRGGLTAAFAAWLGFTAPSAAVMTLAAYGLTGIRYLQDSFVIPGLLMLTVAVVAHAVWSMGKKLCSENGLHITAAVSAAAVLFVNSSASQILVILASGIAGYFMYKTAEPDSSNVSKKSFRKSYLLLGLFFALLILLPLTASSTNFKLFEIFYRAGALVFGGGHVVLPLLQAEMAKGQYLSEELFLSGYGIAQLVPGPLFTFASFLGTSAGGFAAGVISLIGIFMSTFLLVPAVLPIWDHLSTTSWASSALKGVNAGVVGILLAALYDPVFIKGVNSYIDFGICVIAFILLLRKAQLWVIALFCLILGVYSKITEKTKLDL